jgi:flagellar protein FlgJ
MANSLNATSAATGLAIDANSLNSLRTMSKDSNSEEALKGAAKQFEAIFLNMVMKSMREATPSESPFDSEQSKMFMSMLDQELTQKLADRGIGLAEVLVRQLSQNKAYTAEQLEQQSQQKGVLTPPEQTALRQIDLDKYYESGVRKTKSVTTDDVQDKPSQEQKGQPAHVEAFRQKFNSAAQAASRETGIPANFILAHAALETGWGKKEIVTANGTASHNVFGIKAGGQWRGKVVEAQTTEYVDGVARQQTEKFRAYDSYTDAFKDYANLLGGNKRYQDVIANAKDASSFATGLQRAGYATDPQYAQKLTRIIKESLPV